MQNGLQKNCSTQDGGQEMALMVGQQQRRLEAFT